MSGPMGRWSRFTEIIISEGVVTLPSPLVGEGKSHTAVKNHCAEPAGAGHCAAA